MRSLRPSSRPALCGPRMPLPPENATRSKPIFVYFQRFSTGGTSAAASLKVGTRVLLAELDELLVLDPALLVVVVVEEHHGGLLVDRPLQIFARLDLDQAHAAVAHGVVVAEAMGLLDDDLALHAGEVRAASTIFC